MVRRKKVVNGPDALRAALSARRMNYTQAATLTGLSLPMIAFLANGKRVPGLQTARLLRDLLGVSIDAEWPPERGSR